MVKIHKCKDCGQDIYYKPEFSALSINGRDGYVTSFTQMNLDKTKHSCNPFKHEKRVLSCGCTEYRNKFQDWYTIGLCEKHLNEGY